MGGIIYLRLKKHITVKKNSVIRLKDIAFLSGNTNLKQEINETFIYKITDSDQSVSVIDGFIVVEQLVKKFPSIEIQQFGPNQTIVQVERQNRIPSLFMVSIIWLLLFIGSAMAIMNFHYDVSMRGVQIKLHYLLTGEETNYPLWMQIPYSLGLGIGMILFFNHLFKKRFNEEPSPLEIELFKYQQDLDSYVSHYENSMNNQKNDNK
ncbi:stage V sporulation protein AA [Aquibacillus albus]|uniref:Stage V sporulation protein AA n=1 Tax=Aquibacillus albus TaxID=1168171 RepID=A0ABS2MV44_9BACI|nr:stage V sporulation protein AA [Aquibacillus albus]MBM7569769.1 stage V sporulation protein AA [Aquibacillus albus]